MERLRSLGAEIIGWVVSFCCWFTPAHCDHFAKVLAVLIGVVTLLFITLPKAWDYQVQRWRGKK